jgi:zinc protease
MMEGMDTPRRTRPLDFPAAGLLFLLSAFLFLFMGLPGPARGQEPPAAPAVQALKAGEPALDEQIPVDPKITVGELPNGLRYWIRENREPRNRADLRLVVRAGSVLEDEDQRGLAHMVEHLAFNGTRNFPRQKLVEFMESIGMRFGPDLNAFTGFDETIYLLKVPTDSPAILQTAFLILEDWAHGLTFDPAAVEKERGVIVEEWRLDRGADARMRDQQLPVLLRGSRYAERPPIGRKEVIETFEHETLKRFYRTWYRPDLMAVIAVGDFDGARIEELVKRRFGAIPRAANAPPRPDHPIPDHDETLFAIAADKEATDSVVAVYHKLPLRDQSTVGAYRQMLVERLFNGMLNERFSEMAQRPGAPFLGAVASSGPFIGSKEVFVLSALVEEGGVAEGLRALYAEGERVARFGFTPTELERQKSEMMRIFESALAEKETESSSTYAEEFTRAFLEGEPTPGIAYEYEMHARFLPGITLEEIDRLTGEWMSESNRVIMVNVPEKPGVPVPREEDLLAVLEAVEGEDLAPYEDETVDEPLLAEPPEPGEIVSERAIEAIGAVEWTLSNGARVVLKPTDFKEDEILVRATSAGGVSLAEDEDLVPANTADQVVSAGGLGVFSAVALQKKLAGQSVFVRPTIGELDEGLTGNASPRDAETLFQLIHLMFTAPRPDPEVFEVIKTQFRSYLENRAKSPETVFSDVLRTTLQRDHPRFRPMTVEEVAKMDLERSLEFYRDRFADAGDFTFVFVGRLDPEAMKPLVRRYLASLPSLGREETWRDWRISPPEGVVVRSVEMGVEPKSLAAVVFSGPFRNTAGNRTALRAAAQVLEVRLRKLLREELGGTYDVAVRPAYSQIPREEYRVTIDLGADPARIDALTAAIFREIKKLKSRGPTEREIEDFRAADLRTFETSSRMNAWWLARLTESYRLGDDPGDILRFPESLNLLTKRSVRDAARLYFNTGRYVQVTLYPER